MPAEAPVQSPPPETRRVRVAVAGAPPVTFCVNPAAEDPVAAWFEAHDWIDEPVQRAFLDLIRPGMKVLDLGCHLGTFSLAASALGAHVLAVDAAPEHVTLVNLAAECNGFRDLKAVHTAVAGPVEGDAAPAPTIRFVVRSIHGHVAGAGEPEADSIEVPVSTVDDLLWQVGWGQVDVVKMDIEGYEVAALRGMRRLFGSGSRPSMVLESNADMLGHAGSSVVELRTILVELGYEVLLIDHLRPGVLVEVDPGTIQTESASDVLAIHGRPPTLAGWRIEAPPSREATICRLLDSAASPAAGYRRVAADIVRRGPDWLRDADAVRAARVALDHDLDDAVRDDRDRSRGPAAFDYLGAPEPESRGAPDTVAIWADQLCVAPPHMEMERPFELPRRADEAVLRDLSFHVNRGGALGVLTCDPVPARLLLETIAGRVPPLSGQLTVRGDVVSVGMGGAFEPGLSVRENAVLFGAFLGCHAPSVEAGVEEILAAVGLTDPPDLPLHRAGSDAVVRISLGVALSFRRPDILLISDLPVVEDASFMSWVRTRCAELSDAGTTTVQLVRDRAELVVQPTRALWIEAGRLRAGGHAPSVLEEARLQRLGYRSVAAGWREGTLR